MRMLVGPIKRGDLVLRQGYTELFGEFVSLGMPEPVYLQAAELRARFGLKTLTPCTSPVPSTIAATNYGRMTNA